MTSEAKASILDRWVPVLVSTVLILVGLGAAYGRVDQRQTAEEQARISGEIALAREIMPIEQRVRLFVTRAEWEIRNQTRDGEIKTEREATAKAVEELKASLRSVDSKLNELLLRAK